MKKLLLLALLLIVFAACGGQAEPEPEVSPTPVPEQILSLDAEIELTLAIINAAFDDYDAYWVNNDGTIIVLNTRMDPYLEYYNLDMAAPEFAEMATQREIVLLALREYWADWSIRLDELIEVQNAMEVFSGQLTSRLDAWSEDILIYSFINGEMTRHH